MVISASAYKPTVDQAAYGYLNVKGNAYVLNQSTINNFPEITRSLVNSVKNVQGEDVAAFQTNTSSSSGQILGVFSAGVSLKEAYETEYWIEIAQKAELISKDYAKTILHDCGSIRRMLISSINTAKENSK